MHEDSEDQAGFQQTLHQNFGANKRELESTSED